MNTLTKKHFIADDELTFPVDEKNKLLRPQGLWRFLTPLETPQQGDLGRIVTSPNVLGRNWTLYDPEWMISIPETWEFLRPADDQATFVPLIGD